MGKAKGKKGRRQQDSSDDDAAAPLPTFAPPPANEDAAARKRRKREERAARNRASAARLTPKPFGLVADHSRWQPLKVKNTASTAGSAMAKPAWVSSAVLYTKKSSEWAKLKTSNWMGPAWAKSSQMQA